MFVLTLMGNRIGNQLNIPGEWVSGTIPKYKWKIIILEITVTIIFKPNNFQKA